MTVRLATCAAPQFLIAFEFSAMTITIAALAADLGLAARALPLVFSAYGLAFGSLLLAWGRAVDRLGARRCLIAGLAIFAAGVAATAAAASPGGLLAGRALAGAGAAALAPAGLAATTAAFPVPDQRRDALSWYATAISIGFVLGALGAGLLGQLLSWRAAVASTSVIAAVALVATAALPGRERARPAAPATRSTGIVLVTLAAAAASVALCALTTRLLSAAVAAGCALAALALAGLAWRVRSRAGGPLVPAGHLPLIAGGAAVTATGVTGTLLLSLYLREVREFTPLGAAAMFATFGVTAFAGRRLAGAIAAGRGEPAVLGAGLVLQGVALACISVAAAARSPSAVLAALIAAFGLAHVVANAGVALATARAPQSTHGSLAALVATAQYLGGAIGPLLTGSLVAERAGPGAGIAIAGGASAVCGAIVSRAGRR